MSNNSCFIQYYFSIIPFTYNSNIVECFTNRNKNKLLWSASIQFMTSICFRIGLNLNGLTLALSFEIFQSIFFKATDFQGIKDSSLIFLKIPTSNFPLIRLSRSNFFPINGLWFIIIKTSTYNLTNIFVFDYP